MSEGGDLEREKGKDGREGEEKIKPKSLDLEGGEEEEQDMEDDGVQASRE